MTRSVLHAAARHGHVITDEQAEEAGRRMAALLDAREAGRLSDPWTMIERRFDGAAWRNRSDGLAVIESVALEVMQRADFACEECGDRGTTLNVHHRNYAKGRNPWEYPLQNFRCLCEPCHQAITDLLQRGRGILGNLDRRALEQAVAALVDLVAPVRQPEPAASARLTTPDYEWRAHTPPEDARAYRAVDNLARIIRDDNVREDARLAALRELGVWIRQRPAARGYATFVADLPEDVVSALAGGVFA